MAKQPAVTPPSGKFEYTTTLDGKPVVLRHVFKRRYTVTVAGKELGYITAKDPSYAINRIEGATLATLKLH